MNNFQQFVTGLVLALIVAFILAFPKFRRAKPKQDVTPDVATKAAKEPIATPMSRYDVDLEADLIVDAKEQEEYERLYGRLRWHADVALQRGGEQLI